MSTLSADSILVAARPRAYEALLESTKAEFVGDHRGVAAEGEHLVSHLFDCTMPGYHGWYWAVGITRAADSETVTVNEVVVLPGDTAIVSPPWTPYVERIQAGDLSPGDVLPPPDHDPRLAESWAAGDADDSAADRHTAREIGLGRKNVLSVIGRTLAAERWYEGSQGPDTPIAQQAPGVCHTCGFLARMAGPLGENFGVCANAMANDDGRVVALAHGCGAHSDAKLGKSTAPQVLPPPVYDTLTTDDVDAL